jgi:hypothetical protein
MVAAADTVVADTAAAPDMAGVVVVVTPGVVSRRATTLIPAELAGQGVLITGIHR